MITFLSEFRTVLVDFWAKSKDFSIKLSKTPNALNQTTTKTYAPLRTRSKGDFDTSHAMFRLRLLEKLGLEKISLGYGA